MLSDRINNKISQRSRVPILRPTLSPRPPSVSIVAAASSGSAGQLAKDREIERAIVF